MNLETPLRFTAELPKAVDVCIVGGGVIGISTAYYLAEQGHKVLVCEKGRVAGEQSSRNWGWVRQTGRDPAELPIMMESLRLWQDLANKTGDKDLLFKQEGVLYLADSDTELSDYEAFLELARQHQLDSRLLSSAEVAEKIPHAKHKWQGALYTGSDGRMEPWGAVPALARAAAQIGATIIEECAVRWIDSAAGEIAGVFTEHGYVKTDRVLMAGGAWSSLLARQSGVRLPQLTVRATVARLDSPVPLFAGNAVDNELAFAARQDGGYTLALDDHQDFYIGPDAFRFLQPFLPAAKLKFLENRYYPAAPKGYPDAWSTQRNWAKDAVSPFEQCRVIDPQVNPKLVSRMLRRLRKRFPDCADAKVTHSWAGMIDTAPDFVPVMDQVASIPGLFIASCFSGHGFGIGPGAGRVMSDLLMSRKPGYDLSRFRLSRFSDGSRLVLGPM